MDFNFNIIKKSRGEAVKYAPYVVELYEKQNGKTVQIEEALERLRKDAASLNGNKKAHKILLCFETDPYPADYDLNSTTREAIRILDENGLKYVIFTENAMRAIDDFKPLKHPKNTTLIIKIEHIPHDKKNKNQVDEAFMNFHYSPIRKASKKGVRIGIQFGPGSDPMASLYLIRNLHSYVDMWIVGNNSYEPTTVVRSKWKKFKEDAKSKDFFKTLGPSQSLAKYDINTISGIPRLLLIAPHGVATTPQDDINTDKLTLKIAEKLKCSAIVNDVISRLYLDFNKVNEASKHKKFISVIDNVLKAPGPTLVVWIHGIDNDNLKTEIKELKIKENVQCLIGYGRGQPNRLTAEEKTVYDMIRLFKDNSIIAYVARDGSNYCGHSIFLMNQWLRSKGYKFSNSQSVQLEFKYQGIRDPKSLEIASHNIANALSQLVDFKYHVEQQSTEIVESEQSGEEIATNLQAKQLEIIDIPIETEPVEMKLVEEAYHHLATIFSKHYENAMLDAGQYIIEKFYDGDIELARNNKPTKKTSLRKLEDLLKTKNPNSPSKSWLHYSIQLFVETNQIKEKESKITVQTYGQLPVSHKILLFPIRKRDTKIKLIQETVQNNCTYVQLKDRIAELKAAEKPKLEAPKSLLQVLMNPDLLFSDIYANEREEKSLSKRKLPELEKIYKRAEAKLSGIEHDVEEIELKLTMNREYARNYKKLLKSVERAKEKGRDSTSESRVKKGGRNRWYEITSALQKSIRWCDVNESRYFARELMDMGYPGGVLNQLILIAAEDVGLADPSLIVYERECSDSFENLIKQNKMKKRDAVKFPALCNIVDRAVIAAAISYKSRLLPQFSFATLFDIYQNEDFSKNLPEYLDRFIEALGKRDEKQTLYNAYVAGIFLNSMDKIVALIQRQIGLRNGDLNRKWVDEYKKKGELLMLAGSVALLCRGFQYPHGEYKDAVYQYLSVPIEAANIPDRAYDMHTSAGARKGRGLEHFFNEAATVKNERFQNDWEQAGRNAYISADKEGFGKAVEIIKAIKKKTLKNLKNHKNLKKFIIELPFDYKEAVLTQARTSPHRPYAFIVEFNDGSRKFMKGPFKSSEYAKGHVVCNEVKRKLASKYLHPIQCEVREYGAHLVFLVCEEIGAADLNNVTDKRTELEGCTFEVLEYTSNDVIPDPLAQLTGINKKNRSVWTEVMVNYCFRWVFGIGDTARRNLMYQKSTGKIYSTDETGIENVSHENIWGGKKPDKETFKLVREFTESRHLNEVLIEVKRWNESLDLIRREVVPLSKEVEGRIDKLLNNPIIVFDI